MMYRRITSWQEVTKAVSQVIINRLENTFVNAYAQKHAKPRDGHSKPTEDWNVALVKQLTNDNVLKPHPALSFQKG